MPRVTSEDLSVKGNKKELTNTRLATADELSEGTPAASPTTITAASRTTQQYF